MNTDIPLGTAGTSSPSWPRRTLRIGLVALLVVSGLAGLAAAGVPGGSGPSAVALVSSNGSVEAGIPPVATPGRTPRDSDGDWLIDSMERVLGTDPADPDTDGDHLADGKEVAVYFTDPLEADTDGDGYSDSYERNVGTNPRSADTDGDSISDARELALGTNPRLRDSDGDGLSDRVELLLGISATGDPVDESMGGATNAIARMQSFWSGLGGQTTRTVLITAGGMAAVGGVWAVWRWYRRFTSPLVVKTEQ